MDCVVHGNAEALLCLTGQFFFFFFKRVFDTDKWTGEKIIINLAHKHAPLIFHPCSFCKAFKPPILVETFFECACHMHLAERGGNSSKADVVIRAAVAQIDIYRVCTYLTSLTL